MSGFLGIAREAVFSPGKVDADRLILEAVADLLRRRGHTVTTLSAEGALPDPPPGTVVFTMSQGPRALATLREWERRGVAVVNPVQGILATHRRRMTERLAAAGVPTPDTLVIDDRVAWPTWLDGGSAWLKRGDVHATEAADVVHVHDPAEAAAAFAAFRARGIAAAVLQRHVPGPVVKFYGVGDDFVHWSVVAGDPALPELPALPPLARAAARALDLDVYGGDCVIDAQGTPRLIDVNDWPSFAPCRAAAADAIARRLEHRSHA